MTQAEPIRILYIEDDPGQARLVQKRLGRAGYTVDIASDGEEGVAKYKADSYDLLFVDQSLPIHDGLEVIRILGSNGPLPPTVMITGTGDERVAVEAMKLGTSDYILKDVEGGYLELLPSVVEKVLQQRRSIEERQQAQEAYRAVVEHSLQGLHIIQGGRKVFVNSAYAEMVGYTEEELLALSPEQTLDLVHPEDRELVGAHYRDLIEGNPAPQRYEFRVIRKDGSMRWVEAFASRIEYHGKPASQEAMIDITERKQTDDLLRESEERYRSLIENVDFGINLIDADHNILMANAALSKGICKSASELIGRKCFWVFEKRDAVCPHCPGVQAMATGRPAEVETEGVEGDPDLFPARIQAFPVFGQDGTASGFIEVVEDITKRKQVEKDLMEHKEALKNSFFGTAEALSKVIEDRDPYTSGHSLGVAALGEAIARVMGFSEDELTGIYIAGVLHDIGKMAVPVEILVKPGRQTDMELSLIQMHPQAGYEILKGIDFPWPVAPATLQHHERMDGSGYPQGLTSDKIIPEARILAVADVVDAMTHHRPYRPAFSLPDAIEELNKGRGRLYDPQVVDACLEVLEGRQPLVNSAYSTSSTLPHLLRGSTKSSALPTATMMRSSGRR
jgi:PAS domain S-box-containing protein